MSYLQLRYIIILFLYYQKGNLEVFCILEKEYIGCYADQFNRTLPYGKLALLVSMTNGKCASHCCSFLMDATYMGTEAGHICFCSNVTDTNSFLPRNPDYCRMSCDGNIFEICGGSWSLSVYKIDCSIYTEVKSISPKPSDISTVFENTSNSPSIYDKQTDTSTATVARNNSGCSCQHCLQINDTGWTKEEIDERLTLLRKAISVNKKQTNLYKATKRSASDHRKSSRNIGICGVIVLVLPVIFVLAIDISKNLQS